MSYQEKVWSAFLIAILIVLAFAVLLIDGPRLLDFWRVNRRKNARRGRIV